MLSVMYHRGPDADGKIVINDHLALGHRRLAIIDLDTRSDQPMFSERGNTFVYKYLPIDVIERKKVGFPVPLDKWIDALYTEAKFILKDADWLKTERLEEIITECSRLERGGQILWMMINVELFRKMYFSKEWRY